MKLIFRDLTTPLLSFKCGPAVVPIIDAGLGVVGGVGSSLIEGQFSSDNVSRQLGAQREENQKNRDWQTEQAEINRQFQQTMLNQQNQFQTGLQSQQQRYNLESMAKQAFYNSPVYQRQQLQAAGLNPNVYFGSQSSFGGSSAVAGGSPSAPSVSSGSMPGSVGGLSPIGYQPPNLQIGQILKDIADARKSMSETRTTDLMRDPMYKEVMSKVKNQELVNQYQALSNFVFNETKSAQVQRAFVELSKAQKDCILADDQHTLNAAEKRYKESLVALNKASEALSATQAMLFGLKVDNFAKDFESELAVRRSAVASNYASAEASRASVEKMSSEKDYQDMVNSLKKGSLDAELNSMLSSYAAKSQENASKVEEFRVAYNRYKKLNENNENGAANYFNYILWYLKDQMPSLPIVPFLKLGK